MTTTAYAGQPKTEARANYEFPIPQGGFTDENARQLLELAQAYRKESTRVMLVYFDNNQSRLLNAGLPDTYLEIDGEKSIVFSIPQQPKSLSKRVKKNLETILGKSQV